MSVDAVLTIIQTLSLVALVFYVWKTWQIAAATKESAEIYEQILREMRDAREAEVAPYVIVYFDIDRTRDALYLVIKNVGKSLASNVKLQFNPPLKNTNMNPLHSVPKIEDSPLVRNGIDSMPPGFQLRLVLDRAGRYIDKSLTTQGFVPMIYYVTVTYAGGLRQDLTTMKYTIDLNPYRGFFEEP